ncbi:hypothetical protein Snas_5440 [Stackebrandtia nassauensis DSM 44728]|uniref:DUF4238 domain-containing protein n=2 Tax=Stackebrandtia TaxID=283810 RepID=D3PVV1_STANL|nr:hypothetical protein Snas_5440 [Stackebrandtia nassauensis DSM 44728]
MHKDFYTLNTVDVNQSAFFEKVLGDMEDRAARIIRLVIEDDAWPLDPKSRAVLAEFAAAQYFRGPNQRRHTEQFAATFLKAEISLQGREGVVAYFKDRHGREITEKEADRLWAQATTSNGPPIRVSARTHMEQLARLLPQMIRYFIGRPWLLLRYSGQSLCTSDTPVSIIPRNDHPPEMGVGLMNAWGLALPLSREVGLLMGNPGPLMRALSYEAVAAGVADRLERPSQLPPSFFNTVTIANARRWIFCHPRDKSMIPSDLPEPCDQEILMPVDDFVELGQRIRSSTKRNPDKLLITRCLTSVPQPK